MNRFKKLWKNIGLIGVGNIASKMLVFFLVPLYTAVLTTEEYGIADTLSIIVLITVPIFAIMIYDGVLRYSLDQSIDKKDVFSFGLNIVLLGFCVLLIMTPILRLVNVIQNYYWEFLGLFLTTALYQEFSYFCRGIEKVGIYTIGSVIATVFAVVFNLYFLLVLKLGLLGYLLSYILSYAMATIYMGIAASLWRYYKSPRKIDYALGKNMIQYSAPLVLNTLSWNVCNYASRYALIFIVGYSATGLYSVANKIPTILTVIGTIFSSAWRISAVEDFGSEDTKLFYKSVFEAYSTFCFCIAAVLILLSKCIGSFLYANDFFIAWRYAPFLIMGACSYKLADFMMTIYTSSKKTKNILYISIIGAFVCLLSSFAMIRLWGIQGASIATFVAQFTILSLCLIDTRKIMVFGIDYKKNLIVFFLLLVETIFVIQDGIMLYLGIVPFILVFIIKRKYIKDISRIFIRRIKF